MIFQVFLSSFTHIKINIQENPFFRIKNNPLPRQYESGLTYLLIHKITGDSRRWSLLATRFPTRFTSSLS